MNGSKQWVQHISGQGEKWLVVYGGDPIDWMVLCKATDGERNRALPKSEYRLCEPPEVWRDVTEECVVICGVVLSHQGADVNAADGYRLRKVHLWTQDDGRQWAFIIEQKVSE